MRTIGRAALRMVVAIAASCASRVAPSDSGGQRADSTTDATADARDGAGPDDATTVLDAIDDTSALADVADAQLDIEEAGDTQDTIASSDLVQPRDAPDAPATDASDAVEPTNTCSCAALACTDMPGRCLVTSSCAAGYVPLCDYRPSAACGLPMQVSCIGVCTCTVCCGYDAGSAD